MLVAFLIVILIIVLLMVFAELKNKSEIDKDKTFWQRFQTMFIEDDDEFWSSNRFAYVFTMLVSNIIMWGCVLLLVIINKEFPEIPQGVIFIYGISNGVASIAKVWQKREERFMSQLENGTGTEEKK